MNETYSNIKAKLNRFGNRNMKFSRTEVSSLITTIESQKEEIESLQKENETYREIVQKSLETLMFYSKWEDGGTKALQALSRIEEGDNHANKPNG